MNCYEAIDVMGDAAEARLQAALVAGFEEHIAACRSCRTYFEQLCHTRRALHHLRRAGVTSPRRSELMRDFRKEFDKTSH